jgi:DNA-binding response OmpR family regulator
MSRILVVDDEANIRMMIRMGLKAAGHEVETAADGEAALALFEAGTRFDLVLLDQRMPGLDGLAVLREVRVHDPQARVVMVTAFGTIDLAREALRLGATDLLRKPFTLDVLRGAVHSALEGHARGTFDNLPSSSPSSHAMPFDYATINGFRIASPSTEGEAEPSAGEKLSRFAFTVSGPDARTHACTVVLPHYLRELVKAHADREEIADADFWRWLSEESLANYLWQNAELPPHGVLQVEELTTGLRRWVDAVLAK